MENYFLGEVQWNASSKTVAHILPMNNITILIAYSHTGEYETFSYISSVEVEEVA